MVSAIFLFTCIASLKKFFQRETLKKVGDRYDVGLLHLMDNKKEKLLFELKKHLTIEILVTNH